MKHPLHSALWATKLSDITGNNTSRERTLSSVAANTEPITVMSRPVTAGSRSSPSTA